MRKLFQTIFLCAAPFMASAQNGLSAINEATSMLISYIDPITRFIMAVSAVIALFGVGRVYSKSQSGDPDAVKSGISWIVAMLFLIIGTLSVRSFLL